jgi:hypothetical protein
MLHEDADEFSDVAVARRGARLDNARTGLIYLIN